MQYGFGSGTLWAIPSVTNPTPVKFGVLQDVTIDFAFNNKELYGQKQFPVTIARGTGKITGKAKFGQIQGALYNTIFFSDDGLSAGTTSAANDETGTIPATPYAVTVTNSSAFVDDLGVRFALTGLPLTRVASGPTTGQYSVAAGVYTFAAADTTLGVLISYTYTTSTGGFVGTISNQLLGVAPTFKIVLSETYDGKSFTLILNSCISSKLSIPTKQEDFMVSEIDFAAFADSSGNILTISTVEK